MKCKNCGGEIQLEDLYCPYCGSPNEEAQKHAMSMHRYRQEFQKTREDVIERAGRQSRRAVRIAAVAFLLLAIGVNIFLQANSFSIRRMIESGEQRKNAELYLQKMESYLEEEDYFGFAGYCAGSGISMTEKEFESLYPVYRTAQNYKYAASYIMELINHGRYTTLEQVKTYVSQEIQSFYNDLDPEKYSYYRKGDTSRMDGHIEKITQEMEALLVTYLYMTPEQARSMRTMSRGNRVLAIEKGLDRYTE